MESSRILVSGFPDGTTPDQLIIYFQSERDSGGGDVQSIEIDRGQAVITFENVKVAARVLRKRTHYYQKLPLQVSLLPSVLDCEEEESPTESIERDVQPSESVLGALNNRSENQTRSDHDNRRRSCSVVSDPRRRQGELSPAARQSTVLVTGLTTDLSEDDLTDYFENVRRSKGGPVSKVDINRERQTCFVAFESPDDASRTVKQSPHQLGPLSLNVSFIEATEEERITSALGQGIGGRDSNDEKDITIVVSGILPSKEDLWDYFENKRKSGGGEVLKVNVIEEGVEAIITFAEVKDPKRLLEGPHSIANNPITVTRQPPRKEIPLDPLRIHVKGVDETKAVEGPLRNYLEKFADVDIHEVSFGGNNNALVTFEAEPDFTTFIDKVNKDGRGFKGSKLQLERVPVCSCIHVSGLKKETSHDAIELYFESDRKSGGSRVIFVERDENSKDEALVYFEDPSSVHNVMERSHFLDERELAVKPHYPIFEDTGSKCEEITFDADLLDYIKTNHDQELQAILEENKALVDRSSDSKSSTITIFPSPKKGPQKLWQQRVGQVELFLRSFAKIEVPIAAELFDEITRRWKEQLAKENPPNYLVIFNAQSWLAQIFGKKDYVNEEESKLKDLIQEVERDTELMKSVVEVVETDFQRSRLILLQICGVCETLQNRYPHLTISIDLNDNKLFLKGPRSLLQEAKLEIYMLGSKVIEQSIRLSANLMNVLKKPQVLNFTQHLLEQKGIQALFVSLDESKDANEVQVIGIGEKSVADAEEELLSVIQEKSLHLTQENSQVLESLPWKNFHSELLSKFKVGIFAVRSASTVWVSGIAEDVEKCYNQVKDFLDANTIKHDTLHLDHGSTRFIFEKWSSRLDEIKKDLAPYCVNMKASPDVEGIQISGTADGVKKCILRLQHLANAVKGKEVPVDMPGMTKFFLHGKGSELLKAIEDNDNCVILTKQRSENKSPGIEVKAKEVTTPPKLICSNLTQEGKKISVFKGDITKHSVDAIVNPANGELKHSGGLARAIVRAGGQEIQAECNEFTIGGNVLLEGRTIVTTAGKLPCEKVIHVVGPKWDWEEDGEAKQQKQRELTYAISNCLKEAEKLCLKTIAIPAVSSGIYRFPPDLCAKVVLSAVLDFCKKNPFSTLSEIHLVDINDATVAEFEEQMKKRFVGEAATPTLRPFEIDVEKQIPRPSRNRKLRDVGTPTSDQRIIISVKIADLSKEKADILVGSAASDLNLERNPCARALSEAAGPSLQQQCNRKGPLAEGDIVVIDQTGRLNCKAVIFAICPPWENGKGLKVLKGLLTKCLKEADKQNVKSIAFAAIGTGILSFPRDQVAKVYFDEVCSYNQKNPKTKLEEVRFVLHDKDKDTIQAFHSAEKTQNSAPISAGGNKSGQLQNGANSSSPATSAFSPVKERNSDHLETTVGNLCFQVQPGDVTHETTDAIAVITNSQLDLTDSAAGKAILQAGGSSIKTECSRHSSQGPGSVTVINAGDLNATHLFLIVPVALPLTSEGLKAITLQCLQEAEKRRISSISFPALGTGNLGLDAKTCALSMLSAIWELSRRKPSSLRLIKMRIFQKSMVKDFRLALIEECGREKPVAEPGCIQKYIQKPFQKMVGALGFAGDRETKTTPATTQEVGIGKIDLFIVAGSDIHLQRALKSVRGIMKENCKQQVIKDPYIDRLTKDHMQILHTLELRYQVKVTVEKEVRRIVIDGQTDDVLQVLGEIHAIIHEVKKQEHERNQAKMWSEDIQWMRKTGEKFEEYNSDLNARIELAYRQRKQSVIFENGGEKYQIDFDAMTMEDAHSIVTEVRRIDLRKDVEFPIYWCPQPTDVKGNEETVHLFELDPIADSQEHKKVSDLFLKSCPRNKIIKIERVQNPALYETYAINKQRMEKARGSNEMCLFHGTKGPNCELINHKGFNRSFCGENGVVYGNGVYFAKESSYSARPLYSPQDDKGHRYMYLARVLVGEYTDGRRGLITPPPKSPDNVTDTYDTVVDKLSDPSIFVAFYDWQCYPEYLITFQ